MNDDALMTYLLHLKLSYFQEHHLSLAKEAVDQLVWRHTVRSSCIVVTAGATRWLRR